MILPHDRVTRRKGSKMRASRGADVAGRLGAPSRTPSKLPPTIHTSPWRDLRASWLAMRGHQSSRDHH